MKNEAVRAKFVDDTSNTSYKDHLKLMKVDLIPKMESAVDAAKPEVVKTLRAMGLPCSNKQFAFAVALSINQKPRIIASIPSG